MLPRYPGGLEPPPRTGRSPKWLAAVVGVGAVWWLLAASVQSGWVCVAVPVIGPLVLIALAGIGLYEQNRDDRP